jgi:hypothetical protein
LIDHKLRKAVFTKDSTGTYPLEKEGYLFPKGVNIIMLNSDDFVFYFLIGGDGPFEVFEPYEEVVKFIN